VFFKKNTISKKNIYIKKINNIFKVFTGNFNSYKEANNFKLRNNIKGFIVK